MDLNSKRKSVTAAVTSRVRLRRVCVEKAKSKHAKFQLRFV